MLKCQTRQKDISCYPDKYDMFILSFFILYFLI